MRDGGSTAMAGSSVVEHFLAASAAVDALPELGRLTGEAGRALGFARFAMVHHVPFGVPTPGAICLTDYPLDFLAVYRDAGRPCDPMLRAAERTACGFRWERIDALVRLSPREKAHRDEAARHGLISGYTVPNHVPGEAPGSVSFGTAPGRALDPHTLPAAEALGRFAFEAARRLTGTGAEARLPSYPLTDRQRDCVLLVARGKSDGVIAELLGLGRRTVNEHIEAAKRRYGVATRSQLVVRALLRGEIAFADVAEGHAG